MLKKLLQLLLETFFNTKNDWIEKSSAPKLSGAVEFTILPNDRFIAPENGVITWRKPDSSRKIHIYSNTFAIDTAAPTSIYVLVAKGQNFGVSNELSDGTYTNATIKFYPRLTS